MNTVMILSTAKNLEARLQRPLLTRGVELLRAETQESAKFTNAIFDPEVVIIDLAAARGDVFQTIEQLRKQSPYTPIIAIGPWENSAVKDHALRAGASFYKSGWINVDDLADCVIGISMMRPHQLAESA